MTIADQNPSLRDRIRARRAQLQEDAAAQTPPPAAPTNPAAAADGAVLGAAAALATQDDATDAPFAPPTPTLRDRIRARRATLTGKRGSDVTMVPGGYRAPLAVGDEDPGELDAFYAGEWAGDPTDTREKAGIVQARAAIPPTKAMELIQQHRQNPQGVWREAAPGPSRERVQADQAIQDYAAANGTAAPTGVVGSLMEGLASPAKAAIRGVMTVGGKARQGLGAAVSGVDPELGAQMKREGRGLQTQAEALAATDSPPPASTAGEVAATAGNLGAFMLLPHAAVLPLLGFNSTTEALQTYQAELERRGDPNAQTKAMMAAGVVGPMEAALNAIPVGRLIKAMERVEPGFAEFLKRQVGHALAGGVGTAGSDAARQLGGLAIGAQDQYDVGRTLKAGAVGAGASMAASAPTEAGLLRYRIAERRAVMLAGQEAEASGQAMRETEGRKAFDPSIDRPNTIPEQTSPPTPPAGSPAGELLTPDAKLAQGEKIISPDGRTHTVGAAVGKDQVLVTPDDGGRVRQASAGQLGARGWRRVTPPTAAPEPAPKVEPNQAPKEPTNGQEEGRPEGLLNDQAGPGAATPPPAAPPASTSSTTTPTAPPAPAIPPKVTEVKPPAEKKTLGPAKPWSRRDIEDRIMNEYSTSAGKDVADAQNTADEEQSFSDGSGFTRFAGPMPTELKEAISHRPELRMLIRTNQPAGRSNGADYLGQLGVDRYVARLERAFQSRIEKAKDAMRDDRSNPVARFLVALHDNLPKGKRPTKESIEADQLPVGSAFEIDGHKFTVEEGEGGYRILKDGNTFPQVELDAFGKLPIDKGTIEKPAAPAPKPPAAAPGRTYYRGSGRESKESVYSEYAPGGVLGDDATYYAHTREDAANYGPNIEETSGLDLKNPLRIRTDQDWKRATGERQVNIISAAEDQAGGVEGKRGAAFDARVKELVAQKVKAIRDRIEASGHDGVVIEMDPHSDDSRRLYELFGHDQTIVFRKPEAKAEPERVKPAQGSLLGERYEGATTGKQRGLFGAEQVPPATAGEEHPGIRPGESVDAYKRRMGETDTPSMFGEGESDTAPEEFKDDEVAPFAPDRTVRLKGDEIGPHRTGPTGPEIRAYTRENLIGKSFRNAETGEDWMVTRRTISHVINVAKSPDARRLIAGIPDLIRTGELAEVRAPDRAEQPNLTNMRVFRAEAEVDGRPHTVDLYVKTFDQAGQPVNGLEEIHVLYSQSARRKGPPDTGVGPGKPGSPFSSSGGPSEGSIGRKAPEVKPESWSDDLEGPGSGSFESLAPGSPGKVRSRSSQGNTEPSVPPAIPPTSRTSAQRPSTSPSSVKATLRAIRQRGVRDAEGVISIRRAMDEFASALNMRGPRASPRETSSRKASGFYRFIRGGIVLDKADNFSTFAHEMGHAFHEVLFPQSRSTLLRRGASIGALFPRHWQPELVALGRALYGNRKPNVGGYATEGWAEVIRKLVVNPASLKRQAPTVYREVTSMLMARSPEAYNALLLFRARIKNGLSEKDFPLRRYLYQPNRSPLADWAMDAYDRLVVAPIWDRHIAAVRFEQDLKTASTLRTSESPEARVRLMAGRTQGHMNTLLEHGTWDLVDHSKTGPGLVEILRPIEDAGRRDEFEQYMVMKRVREKRDQGFGGIFSHIDDAEVNRLISKGDADPVMRTAADQFQTLNRWLVQDYAVHYGLITPEAADRIVEKNQDYITFRYAQRGPFGAMLQFLGLGGSGARRGMADQSSGFKRFRGSSEELLPPIESFIENAQGIIKRAQANYAARGFTDLWAKNRIGIPEISRWLEKVPTPKDAQSVMASQYRQRVREDLEKSPLWQQLSSTDRDDLIDHIDSLSGPTFFQDSKAGSKMRQGMMSVLVDGKREWYQVNSTGLGRMFAGLENPWQAEGFAKLLTWHARGLRATATTYSPTFISTNLIKDTVDALVMSEARQASLPKHLAERARQIKEAFLGGDTLRLARIAGVDMSSIFHEARNASTGRPSLNKVMKEGALANLRNANKSIGERVSGFAGNIVKLEPIARMNEVAERVNRLAEFNLMRDGRTDVDALTTAALAARDVTLDFGRGGHTSKVISQFIPFFNAAILGTNKLGRFILRDPLWAARTIGTHVVLPSLALAWWNRDDEGYARIPREYRDRNWIIPLSHDDNGDISRAIVIPKPNSFAVFSNLAERTIERLWGTDPASQEKGTGDPGALDHSIHASIYGLMPRISGGAVQLLWELYTGYDVFRNRPIVPARDQNLPVELQGASVSSDFARTMGHFLDVSPANIDHALYGVSAGLGRDATRFLVDPSLRATGIPDAVAGPRPAAGKDRPMTPGQWPIIRGFYMDTPPQQTEALIRFREDLQRLRGIKAKVDRYTHAPDLPLQAYGRRLLQLNARDLQLYRLFQSADSALTKLFKARNNLRPGADPDQAMQRAKEIEGRIHDLVRRTYSAARSMPSQEPPEKPSK